MEIYKRYRPQTWGELVGQDKVARSLQSAVKHDHVPTAYLFSGPVDAGKPAPPSFLPRPSTVRILLMAIRATGVTHADLLTTELNRE